MPENIRYPNIAIIGAGPAGLTAIKCLLEAGLNPTAFEQSAEIGGNWRYDESLPDGGGLAYRSLKTNTSRRMTAYSDFPFPAHLPEFLTRADVLEYLHAYTDHFQLHPHIRFQTTVETVTHAEGHWQITVRQPTGTLETYLFDAVIIASGFYHQPFIPSFPGAESFQGRVLHSAAYKGPEGFEGQHVIIIGSGSSGADIAAELSESAARVEISSRSGTYFISQWVNGQPYDTQLNRLGRLIPPNLSKPLFRNIIFNLYKKAGFTEETLGLLRLPAFDPVRARFVPTGNLLEKILHRTVHLKPDIAQIEPDGVIYTDHTHMKADALIYCTGYSLGFPFLAPTIISVTDQNHLGLYKRVFHPEFDTLAFLAMNFVAGSALPLAEMQARWVARVFAGQLELPPPAIRTQAIAQHFADCKRQDIHPMSVQLADYLDELADLLAVRPQSLHHPELLRQLWLGPLVSAQYRLDGPGKSAQAKEMILGG